MSLGKIFLTNIVVILFVGFSLNSHAQGCMGGGEDGVSLRGFIQPQFNYNLNGTGADGNSLDEANFSFNRARLGVLGSIPYDIEYYFFVEMSSFKNPQAMPHMLDAFVSYTRFGQWAKISMGQFKTPFSLEQNTACSGLYTVNRSAVVGQLAGPQRDLGIMISGGSDDLILKYSVGLMNGVGMNVLDNNINKEVVARLVINPFDFLHLGGSFRMGKINPTNAAEDLNDIMRYGAELLFNHKGIRFQAEYIMAEDKLYSASRLPIYGGCGGIVGYDTKQAGTYRKGGYMLMLSYMTPWNLEPVVKYDTYDPDFAVVNDNVDYLTIGINYFVNDYSRVQINYVKVMEANPVVNDMIMVQLQAKLK